MVLQRKSEESSPSKSKKDDKQTKKELEKEKKVLGTACLTNEIENNYSMDCSINLKIN